MSIKPTFNIKLYPRILYNRVPLYKCKLRNYILSNNINTVLKVYNVYTITKGKLKHLYLVQMELLVTPKSQIV